MTDSPSNPHDETEPLGPSLVRAHLALGWGALLVFILLGVVLEGLHAFKVPMYLDAESESRRFLWRLAHAHGALLSIVHLAAAWTFSWASKESSFDFARLTSRCLTGALITLPGGFFLGGVTAVDGDPGVGIVLVPVGAILLVTGVTLLLVLARKKRSA
jgi:hypothetical protein